MKLFEVETAKNLLLEGGNLVIGDVAANRIDSSMRAEVVPIVDSALQAINASFQKFSKAPLWSPALLKSREFLSGSAFHFFDRAQISDAEFKKVKDTVGDIDTQVDREQTENITAWLNALPVGTKIGPAVFAGAKPSGEQFITLWTFPDIQMVDAKTGRRVPMNIQIDLELKKFDRGTPSSWSKFSASSAWADLSQGVKGVFHKYLIQSLAVLTKQDFLLRKMAGRGAARAEQDVPASDKMLSFAVSSKEGGGLRSKYEPVLDDSTGKPLVKDGLPVLRARPTTDYDQNIVSIFQKLLGNRVGAKELKAAESKLWSFTELSDLVNQVLSPEEKQQVLAEFIDKIFGPSAQGLYINDPVRDSKEKSVALDILIKKLGVKPSSNLAQLKKDYAKAYKIREQLAEEAPDYRRVGIKHIYNPGSSAEMKDSEFLDMIDAIAKNGGNLDGMPVNLKVDGAGIRFGKDASGRPFMMTSRINTPLYAENIGDFEKFSQNRGQEAEQLNRARTYDQALNTVVNGDFIKTLPTDTIVQAEMLFTPMAEKTPGGLKFVNIPYDSKKLGKTMTLVPFSFKQYTTGQERADAQEIKQMLLKKSNTNIKFVDNQLNQQGINVSKIIQPVTSMPSSLRDALSSRKASDEKIQAKEILTKARQELSEKIINSPQIQGRDQLGKNIEGLVINLPNGQLAKVTSPQMKQAMSDKKSTATKQPSRTAVVAIGSFVGHRGHQQLFDYTVKRAKELGGDPYLFMGSAVGQDDPVPIADKIQTWRQLYPQYAKNISAVNVAGGSLMQKIKHELINPTPGRPPRYDNIIIMVGEDRKDMPIAAALMKAVNRFPGYEHVRAQLEVTPRGTGMSFTKLRNSLRSDDTDAQFQLWRQAFDGSREFGSKKLPDSWIQHLMDVSRQGMGLAEEAAGVGIITKQNTTKDVKPGETQRQAAKFGNRLDSKGRPPRLREADLKLGTSSKEEKNKVLDWIDKVYDQYHVNPMDDRQRIMVWGTGKDQQFAIFELTPNVTRRNTVEVKWFQAYPLRAGVGSRAMKELQTQAQQDGINLTLYPWDKGRVSQSNLMKFYKKAGFKPDAKGSKNMVWEPASEKVMTQGSNQNLAEQLNSRYQQFKGHGMKLREFYELDNSEVVASKAKEMHKDHEVQMARSELYKAAKYAMDLHNMMKEIPQDTNLEAWVQAKITKAADHLASVKHYLEYEMLSTGEIGVEEELMSETTAGATSSGSIAVAPSQTITPRKKIIKRK
jgi:hypothetical protein